MKKKTYTHGIALLIAGAMLANRVIADEVPEVIASIKPLAAIAEAIAGESVVAVSYTHLTLPTICSV